MTGPRRIEVLPGPGGLAEASPEEKFCVVIDVLRACTTIAVALEAGARGVIPVGSVETAMRLAQSLGRDSAVLGGEARSLRVDGFDVGNSPGDYRAEIVAGKTLVLCTTNGARTLAALSGAGACTAAAFVNLGAVVRRLARAPRIMVVCAGSGAQFSLEDFGCAGALVEGLTDLDPDLAMDDGARTAREVWARQDGDVLGFLRGTDHGRRLAELGFAADVELAARVDLSSAVPMLRDGRLVLEDLPAAQPVR